MSLKNRSFLKLLDYTPAEIEELLDLAADLKAKKKAGVRHDALRGKNIALIFEKTSTRTRCSFEVAAHATFDLMFSVLVPPVLEKVIPSVRMFAGIVISGVTVSSLPEHAATKEEKSSADSTRQIWNFSMIFFIMSLRIKNNG